MPSVYNTRDLPKLIGVVVLYLLLAKLSFLFFTNNNIVDFLWPAVGFALGVVLIGGYKYLSGAFFGALLGLLLIGESLDFSFVVATKHTVSVFLGIWLLRMSGLLEPRLYGSRDALRILLLAFGIGLFEATVTQVLIWFGAGFFAETHSFNRHWTGHTLGVVIAMPLVLVWQQYPREWVAPRVASEAALILCLSFLVGQVVFLDWMHESVGQIARGYWMFLFITWTAVRLGSHGAVLLLAVTAIQGIVGAKLGIGFFSDDLVKTQLSNYFYYMLVLSGVGLALTTYFTGLKLAESEREQIASQLRESQKMEALGTLAGGVAHDFNNALVAILGNVELARQDVGPGHAALVSLEEINKAGRRGKDLVQQILSFSRRQGLERKPTSLALVLVESSRLIRATLPVGVQLDMDCKADTPAVLADALQVEQILLNLCANAAHSIQDQGRPGVIEVQLSAYEQTQAETKGDLAPGHYALLSVRDNGAGMDEATRSRIFEPFFTTKPVGKGTGLGLAVVHRIVKAHEAKIEAMSTVGRGSEFRIYFPAIDVIVTGFSETTPTIAPIPVAGKHVLFVDDEETIVFLMKRLLERQGFRVSGYTDPRQAVVAARANPDQFDLVVTDYNMPNMSGLDLASALREIRADLPVVMTSGYIPEELREKAPAYGIRELIYKPDTVDDLCEAVTRFATAQSEVATWSNKHVGEKYQA